MKTTYFTICSFNYLSQAACLYESIVNVGLDGEFVIVLCDEKREGIPPALENVRIIEASEIQIPRFYNMLFKYDLLELNTAVKPFCMAYFMEHEHQDAVYYLDPDLCFYSKMDECDEIMAKGGNIILTPHTLKPVEDSYSPNDLHFSQAGIYNLGFCGVRKSPESIRFIRWWCRKLYSDCRIDLPNGIFVDQKWCDGLPALFGGVHILRHPGYNIGYWNLMHRKLTVDSGDKLMAEGQPVRFLHFSGLEMTDANSLSKHQNRFKVSHLDEVTRGELNKYRYLMIHNNFFSISKIKCKLWGFLGDIPKGLTPSLLNLYWKIGDRVCQEIYSNGIDPWESLIIHRSLNDRHNMLIPIPDMMFGIFYSRSDLQNAFNIYNDKGRIKFIEWFESTFQNEYDKEKEINIRIFDYLDALKSAYSALPIKDDIERGINPSDVLADKSLIKLIFEFSRTERKLETQSAVDEIVQLLIGDYNSYYQVSSGNELPTILYRIWQVRKDLQDEFPLKEKVDIAKLIDWLKTFGEKEYPNTPVLFRPKKPNEQENGTARFHKYKENHPVRKFVDNSIFGLNEITHQSFYDRDILGAITRKSEFCMESVLLIGYPEANMGMGEHVRNTAGSLKSVGKQFGVFNFDTGLRIKSPNTSLRNEYTPFPSSKVNIFHINADACLTARKILGKEFFTGHYNIGYWAWELNVFPEIWHETFDYIDEVWAPTQFIADSISRVTSKPITVMPLRIEPTIKPKADLQKLGIPKGKDTFLFFFDFNSYEHRKNPTAILAAYREAFGKSENAPLLIIKTIGGQDHKEKLALLERNISGDEKIVIINDEFSRLEMDCLINSATAFVSLHRSEGFGRGLAEAMFYGKPVIGTAYSGNMDFMNSENSYLVDYSMVDVKEGEYVAHENATWANPDIDHAARLMRSIIEQPEIAKRKGELARETIMKNHSSDVVAKNILKRLEEIQLTISS